MSTPLHEVARISGGKIVQVHHNACPALEGGRCTCPTTEYRIVRAPKGGRQR